MPFFPNNQNSSPDATDPDAMQDSAMPGDQAPQADLDTMIDEFMSIYRDLKEIANEGSEAQPVGETGDTVPLDLTKIDVNNNSDIFNSIF